MSKIFKKLLILVSLSLGCTALYAVDMLRQLHEISNQAHNTTQREQGRMHILAMLIECQFKESCVLQMPEKLMELQKAQPNPMYPAYMAFIRYTEQELQTQQQFCQIPEKQEVRQVYATCLQARLNTEQTLLPLTRDKMDQLNRSQNRCLKETLQPLAVQGNIFAQAAMVNISEQNRDTQELEHWYNALMKKQDTQEFRLYLKCSGIP